MAAILTGCDSGGDAPKQKAPRPVSVFRLAEIDPSRLDRLTGSVGSWKTEELGFEVTGRVEFVIEPETDVEGQLFRFEGSDAENGESDKRVALREGQQLARLDKTRYELAVRSVQAQIETATQQKKAAAIEVASVIPAELVAAAADFKFRESELKRHGPLVKSGTVTQAMFDRIQADHDGAAAKVAQVTAKQQAKQAEEASLAAKIDELKESLAQARRDVTDCVLRSPFRGQVAQVHVIPGGVVQAGQAVVTVQMMDPIKVDLEVSAETSRRLNYRDAVELVFTQNGTESRERAFVYTIDPVADPLTRTFTVTLLVQNQKVTSPVPAELGENVARARDVWELIAAEDVKAGVHFVETNTIHSDGDGHYVWKVTNWEQVVKKETSVLSVTKVKVLPGDLRVDWLGLWTFREVTIADGEDFDVEHDFVAGELDTSEPLQGDKILLDRQQWRLRPGDLVGVDLSGGRAPSGFYVPIDAIHGAGEKQYVFEVNEGHVRRVEVQVSDGPNTLKLIAAAGDQPLSAGIQLVAGGVHYLVDGEAVNVVEEVSVQK